jgi:hypothetical protein
MNKMLFSFAFFGVVLFTGCHKLCVSNYYKFNGGVTIINPGKDSIRIGDTLWFSSSIPVNLKYKQGNSSDSSYYNLSGATNVATDFHLTTPLGINMQVGAIDSFSFIAIKGSIQSNPLIPHAGKTISYLEEGGNYLVVFGLVAQKKGVYFLSIIDIYQAQKNCDKASVVITMNGADNHLHYLRDIYYGGGPINPIDSTHTYCFKVY